MKRWIIPALALLIAFLTACTPMIYGVPQERWDTMSEQERLTAMAIYQERQIAARKAAAERARLRAVEAERRAAREAEEARLRQARIDAIYRGKGNYGDLLRVTIRGGTMKVAGKDRAYEPTAFKIAEGESKQVAAFASQGRQARLRVTYRNGALVIDDAGARLPSRGLRLVYDREWGWGKTYEGVDSEGPLRLRQATVYVEIAGRQGQARRRPVPQTPPVVIIKEKPAQGPPVIVVTPERDEAPRSVRQNPDPPGRVRIVFLKGEARVRGKHRPLEPQSVLLATGKKRTIPLKTARGVVMVNLGYRDGIVSIEDTPAKGGKKGAAKELKFNKKWKTGETYRISTEGELRLKEVEIEVVAVD